MTKPKRKKPHLPWTTVREELLESEATIERQRNRLEDHEKLFETHKECDAARKVDQDAWGEELRRLRDELGRAQAEVERLTKESEGRRVDREELAKEVDRLRAVILTPPVTPQPPETGLPAAKDRRIAELEEKLREWEAGENWVGGQDHLGRNAPEVVAIQKDRIAELEAELAGARVG